MKAKLILNDQVKVKIEGLGTATRRKLYQKYGIDVPYARHVAAYRLGRWDGKQHYFSMGGGTYLNLLPEILPILIDDGYEIELEDNRQSFSFDFGLIDEDVFSHLMWPKKHPNSGEPIKLRDYQVDAVNNFIQNPQSLQSISTAAGKTLITGALSYMVQDYGRTIVIVPNKNLVMQTSADYEMLGLDVGVYFGDKKEYNKTHTICTWQSLNNLIKNEKIDEFLDGMVAVIVDEAHGVKGNELLSMLTDSMANIPIRWGLTGTIPKGAYEFTPLLVAIGEVTSKLTASELQDKGVLSNCHIHINQTNEYKEYKGYADELKFLVTDQKRLEWLAEKVKSVRGNGNILVLVDRIACGQALQLMIDGSIFISGKMKAVDRKDHYDAVNDNEDDVIIATYGCAAVGINVPRLFSIFLLEPGKSFVRVIQSIGRGLRKAADKDHVDIYDITSTCKYSKKHLSERKKFYNEAQYPYTVTKVERPQ